MVKIFISYRRADSRKDAGRIYDRLIDPFGKENVFKDVDSIPLGKDFRGVLREAVAQCDVLLAIIGRQWLDIKNEHGNRRLDDLDDYLRIEVESGLQRDGCLVIPVLVDNAPMPNIDDLPSSLGELAFKNATIVRDDPDFHKDVNKIIDELQERYKVAPLEPTLAKKKAIEAGYNIHKAIGDFYEAFDDKQWEIAREILSEIRISGKASKIFDIDSHEQDVWNEIEAEERDEKYEMVRLVATRGNDDRTYNAIKEFWQDFPEYDPDEIGENVKFTSQTLISSEDVSSIIGEPFEWCKVLEGKYLYGNPPQQIESPTFLIAKYPITFNQFQQFVLADDGFYDNRWLEGFETSQNHTHIKRTHPLIEYHYPRININWYDAIAFCRWLSYQLGGRYEIDMMDDWLIRLPTEYEWEKAARWTDGRLYPYGDELEEDYSNNEVFAVGDTQVTDYLTPVDKYDKGVSPYGVMDMIGNTLEWTMSNSQKYQRSNFLGVTRKIQEKIVCSSSCFVPYDETEIYQRSSISPFDISEKYYGGGIGFRIVTVP